MNDKYFSMIFIAIRFLISVNDPYSCTTHLLKHSEIKHEFHLCSSYISVFDHQWPTNSIWSISERHVCCASLNPQRKRRVIYEWFKCLESTLSTESVTCYCLDDDVCLSSWIWQTYRSTGKRWKGLDTVRVAFSCGCVPPT